MTLFLIVLSPSPHINNFQLGYDTQGCGNVPSSFLPFLQDSWQLTLSTNVLVDFRWLSNQT